jgi:hypothetical protein
VRCPAGASAVQIAPGNLSNWDFLREYFREHN